jgi:hypothetical protein
MSIAQNVTYFKKVPVWNQHSTFMKLIDVSRSQNLLSLRIYQMREVSPINGLTVRVNT